MTDTIVKLVANQGGPFTQTSNLVDFDIPSDGVYDLSKSFVNIYSRIDTADGAGPADRSTGKAVHSVGLLNGVTTADTACEHFYNVCFVKNASMSTQLNGRLEDINRVDLLRQNLNDLTMERAAQKGQDHTDVGNIRDVANLKMGSLFRELHKEGTVASRDLVAPVKIPLSQLFNLGSLTRYPASKLGTTRIHLELNVDNFVPVSDRILPAAAPGAANFANTAAAGAGGATINSLVSNAKYPLLDDSPYWVGQRVQITTTKTGGTAVTRERIIAGISRSTADDTLTITFDSTVDTLTNGQQLTNCIIFGYQTAPAATFSIDHAQLVLQRVANPGKIPNMINCTTFSTEQAQGNGATIYQRQHQLEPNAINVFLMFPAKQRDGGGNLTGKFSFCSSNVKLRTARLRIDNEDLTNRDVQIATADGIAHQGQSMLLHDRLMMTLMNGGYTLKDIGLANLNRNQSTPNTQRTQGRRLTVLGNPVPMTPTEKLLQVNLTATDTGVEDIVLFKQLAQTLKI